MAAPGAPGRPQVPRDHVHARVDGEDGRGCGQRGAQAGGQQEACPHRHAHPVSRRWPGAHANSF
eukprot:scaffold6245_cov169-Isochrysis_galbana.AAC.1